MDNAVKMTPDSGRVSKADLLCDHDREMMHEFSRLCVDHLNDYLPLKLFLSLFQHFFDSNVLKEIEKNRLVIEHAVAGFEKGLNRQDIDADSLFDMTKSADEEFIKKISTPLLSIKIRYDDFSEIRKKRIVSLINLVFDLMLNWQDKMPLTEALKTTFPEKIYREIVCGILHLYNVETRMLSRSIALNGPAGKVKELFAEKLFDIMEKTAGDVVDLYSEKIYGMREERLNEYS